MNICFIGGGNMANALIGGLLKRGFAAAHLQVVEINPESCARLHQEVPKLTQAGVKVRYLLYPRAGKGSETYNRSIAVWCAKDRVKAIGVAKNGGTLEMKTCANPVDEHVRLGHEVGVEGTPTIVMDDGRVLPGYAPAAELLAALGLQDGKKAEPAR